MFGATLSLHRGLRGFSALAQFWAEVDSTEKIRLLSFRERLPDSMDDLKSRVRNTYDIASDRVGRATSVLRGEEESETLGKVGALLIGIGIGVGIGVLIAPASGEETRADLAEKISDLGDTLRERVGKE